MLTNYNKNNITCKIIIKKNLRIPVFQYFIFEILGSLETLIPGGLHKVSFFDDFHPFNARQLHVRISPIDEKVIP